MQGPYNNLENSEQVPHSLELAKNLEQTTDESELRKGLKELLDSISTDTGLDCTDNVSELYEMMRQENCLARIEKLSNVLAAIELNQPVHISDSTETHYANAVVPLPQGLKIAFSEGQAPGPIRAVFGFGKTMIGFKTDNIDVSEVEFGESDIRDVNERAFLCRHVVGDIRREDIVCMILRIPRSLMDGHALTEKEKKHCSEFILRGFDLKK